MFTFIISASWQILVFWVALQVGLSMQVIDKASFVVTNPELCSFMQQPMSNGTCRITGRAQGTHQGGWELSPHPELPVSIAIPPRTTLIYDVDAWHMTGGTWMVVLLLTVTVALSGLGIVLGFLARRGQIRRREGSGTTA